MKGRRCCVVATGSMNSCMIEFKNKKREIVSRNSIRQIPKIKSSYESFWNGQT